MMGTEQTFETLGVIISLMVLTLQEQFSEMEELHGIYHAAQMDCENANQGKCTTKY
jgi:hypothetical protein